MFSHGVFSIEGNEYLRWHKNVSSKGRVKNGIFSTYGSTPKRSGKKYILLKQDHVLVHLCKEIVIIKRKVFKHISNYPFSS